MTYLIINYLIIIIIFEKLDKLIHCNTHLTQCNN